MTSIFSLEDTTKNHVKHISNYELLNSTSINNKLKWTVRAKMPVPKKSHGHRLKLAMLSQLRRKKKTSANDSDPQNNTRIYRQKGHVNDQTPAYPLMEANHTFSAVKPIHGRKLQGEFGYISLVKVILKKKITESKIILWNFHLLSRTVHDYQQSGKFAQLRKATSCTTQVNKPARSSRTAITTPKDTNQTSMLKDNSHIAITTLMDIRISTALKLQDNHSLLTNQVGVSSAKKNARKCCKFWSILLEKLNSFLPDGIWIGNISFMKLYCDTV